MYMHFVKDRDEELTINEKEKKEKKVPQLKIDITRPTQIIGPRGPHAGRDRGPYTQK